MTSLTDQDILSGNILSKCNLQDGIFFSAKSKYSIHLHCQRCISDNCNSLHG